MQSAAASHRSFGKAGGGLAVDLGAGSGNDLRYLQVPHGLVQEGIQKATNADCGTGGSAGLGSPTSPSAWHRAKPLHVASSRGASHLVALAYCSLTLLPLPP